VSFAGNGPGVRIDRADEAIIAALKRDVRIPFSRIARDLGVSAGMVRQRYNRLVEAGAIQVAVIPNHLVLGHSSMAIVGLDVEPGRIREVSEKLAALDEVIYLVALAGRHHLLAEIVCRDNEHVLEFLEEKLGAVEGVRGFDASMHLSIIKEVYS
jgi:Lrp/AsnC family transcriptional regulator, regulator for asnA, asnC and gidA